MLRVGIGYDIHRLEAGRPLILGGLEIPSGAGLAGHSDGDGLVHAIIDALLGASGEGDIGRLFPDTEPRWKDVRSVSLLAEVMGRLRAEEWEVVNVDAVIVAEQPRLAPHAAAMKKILCPVLGLEESALGIQAKTNEGLGSLGEGRAIACWAVALIQK